MKKEQEGYMTLEASFLIPTSVFLTALLMLLSFYLYAAAFLNQAAYQAAFRASIVHKEEGDRAAIARQELDRLLQEAVIQVGNTEADISVTALRVKVELQTQIRLPGFGLLSIDDPVWQIRVEKQAQIRDAVSFIRGIRKLSTVGEAIGKG